MMRPKKILRDVITRNIHKTRSRMSEINGCRRLNNDDDDDGQFDFKNVDTKKHS